MSTPRTLLYGLSRRRLLKPSGLEPRKDSLDEFGFSLEWQPVAGRQVRHGKILASATHGVSEAAAGNIADPIEFAVDKQHGLSQAAAIGRGLGVGYIGGVVQVPGVTRAKTGRAERFGQDVKVAGRPERRIGRGRWGTMRRTEPTSVGRDQGGPVNLAYGRRVSTPIDRREGRWDVSVEVGDGLFEVGQIEAVVAPLPVRILIGGVELPQCQPSDAKASTCARQIRPISVQPWTKIINNPSLGPASQYRVVWRGELKLRAVRAGDVSKATPARSAAPSAAPSMNRCSFPTGNLNEAGVLSSSLRNRPGSGAGSSVLLLSLYKELLTVVIVAILLRL